MLKSFIPAILITLLARSPAFAEPKLAGLAAQPPFKPTAEQKAQHEARKQWFRDAKFGMFITWGPMAFTPLGGGGVARGLTMSEAEYDQLHTRFNPVDFNADEWVSLAKAAGMKYIVFVTKHHDGFCMWDTKELDYNIMRTPFGRDVVKELAEACRKQDVKLGLYYAFLDWYHPLHPTKGRQFVEIATGKRVFSPPHTVRPWPGVRREEIPNPTGDIPRYAEHCGRQITELVTNYGPLTTLWGDMPYQSLTREEGTRLVNLTRSLQPDILINNRFNGPYDYKTPEQKFGGFNNSTLWESCMCMGGCWSHIPDDTIKSARQCLHMLLGCAGGGGNLLLDVGPDARGRIDPRAIANLRELGHWLNQYGASIYGTRGGPFKPWPMGVSTHKGSTIYLHVQHWLSNTIRLPAIKAKITKATVLTGGEAKMKQTDQAIVLSVDERHQHPWDTIIALELDRPAGGLEPVTVSAACLPPSLTRGKNARCASGRSAAAAVDGDSHTQTSIGDKTSAWLEVDLGAVSTVSSALITEAHGAGTGDSICAFELQYRDGENWRTFHVGKGMDGTLAAQFAPIKAQRVRLLVKETRGMPGIAEFSLFNIPVASQ